MYIVILAGGLGTRLWPLSRETEPKQSKCFFNNKTLLQLTYNRVLRGFDKKDILISCNKSQFPLLCKQVPMVSKHNFILEPEQKGTAMAIGLACLKIFLKNRDAVLAMANSDHFIESGKEYLRILKLANRVVKKSPNHLILIGIKPNYPETGYGYIELGNLFKKIGKDKIYRIKKFKEKPNLKTAKQYLKSNRFLWNPAWFVFKADTMLNLFKEYLPSHFKALENIKKAISARNENNVLKGEFKRIKSISIDYGIMEKAKKMLVIPFNGDWYDIGSWEAVKDCFTKKGKNNLYEGQVVLIDSNNNLVINKNKNKLVSMVGIKDLIVINTKDTLVICPKHRSQEIKKIVQQLRLDKKLNKYL